MSRIANQWTFVKNLSKLTNYLEENDIIATLGGGWRSKAQQWLYYFGYDIKDGKLVKSKKRSNAKYSNHQKRLAQDYNFFIDSKLTYDKEKLQHVGDYWESLNEHNRWGGNFKRIKDTPHFEMNC